MWCVSFSSSHKKTSKLSNIILHQFEGLHKLWDTPMSIGIYMVVMIIFYNYPNLYKNIIVVSIYILAIITFLIWSPLKNENHILTNYQYKRNRKILFGSIVINIIIFVFLSKMNYTIASYEIIFTVLASIFLIIGKLELYQNKKE